MIQDFDGLVGRFSRRRHCMAQQPVCALSHCRRPTNGSSAVRAVSGTVGTDLIHERDLEYAMQRMRLLTRALVTQRCF
jgi:hypothetical protein